MALMKRKKAPIITLLFAASGIVGFGQGVLLGPGQSYVFEFSSLPYSRPATQHEGGSVWAYFMPGTLGAGESVELAIYANSLADTPLISTYTSSGPGSAIGCGRSWWAIEPPYFPDLQGLCRVTMLTGGAELSSFVVQQVVNGGVYSGYFPVPEPSAPALLGLGLGCLAWYGRRTRATNFSVERMAAGGTRSQIRTLVARRHRSPRR